MSLPRSRASEMSRFDTGLVELFDEIADKLQAGEQVDLEAYAQAHPELAEQLRQLVPAIDVLADLGRSAARGDPAATALAAPVESERGLIGEFRIIQEIGRGGMGVVYEAEQVSLGRRVALKVLPFAAALDPKQLRRFKNEAQAAAHLQHQHIVPVYYVGCEGGVHYYAMQYIEGQTLAAVIRELRQLAGLDKTSLSSGPQAASGLASELASGRWAPAKPRTAEVVRLCGGEERKDRPHPTTPPPHPTTLRPNDATPPIAALSTQRSMESMAFFRTVASLGLQAAEALEHAHQLGIVHRDIKPANLLVDVRGHLWVADFGLARLGNDAGLTMTGDLLGTLRYMSPEQALAQPGLTDARTDIYSLGVTLYELLALEPAYGGRTREEVLRQVAFEEPRPPRRLNPAVPVELETIVLKAMGKNPGERYATAQELADDLRRFLEDKPIKARRPTLAQRARKWARRHRPLVWAMGISAALVLTVAIVALTVSVVLITGKQRELESNLYFTHIKLAEREWAVNNMTRVDQLLAECPSDLRGWEWHYLRRLRRGGKTYLPLEGPVFCVGFSADGELLAAGNNPGMVKIWNTKTWREVKSLPRQEGALFTLAFSPEGYHLATASWESKGPRIWDLDTGRMSSLQQDEPNDMGHIVFHPDGRRLASTRARLDQKNFWISIWDSRSGSLLCNIPEGRNGHENAIQCLAFSPDGRYLASGGFDFTLKVWDLATRQQLWSIKSPDEFYRVTYSPDGRLLAAAGGYHFSGQRTDIHIFDAATGTLIRDLKGHTRSVLGLAFSPDGRRLASGSDDLTVKLWDVATGKEAITLFGHRDSIWDVAFSPDGHRLASAGADSSVRIWDATPVESDAGDEMLTLSGHTKEIYSLAISPDGSRLASGSGDLTARIWDIATGNQIRKLGGFTHRVSGIGFSPDGRWLATQSQFQETGRNRIIRIWDTRSWQEKPSFFGASSTLVFSPDSRRIASVIGNNASRVAIYDPNTGQPRLVLPGHDSMVPTLAFSPDGRRLASGSFDNTVKIWDVAPEQELRLLFTCGPPTPFVSALAFLHAPIHTFAFDSRVNGVAFSPDGKRLAAGGMDRNVKIWDTTDWQEILTLRDPTGGIYSLAYSPDGQRIATGGTDATVKLWDASTGRLQRILYGHTHWVSAVVFTPDGRQIASSSFDKTVKLWDVTASVANQRTSE